MVAANACTGNTNHFYCPWLAKSQVAVVVGHLLEFSRMEIKIEFSEVG